MLAEVVNPTIRDFSWVPTHGTTILSGVYPDYSEFDNKSEDRLVGVPVRLALSYGLAIRMHRTVLFVSVMFLLGWMTISLDSGIAQRS